MECQMRESEGARLRNVPERVQESQGDGRLLQYAGVWGGRGGRHGLRRMGIGGRVWEE